MAGEYKNLAGCQTKRKCLGLNDTCVGVAIKCYGEQLLYGWEGTSERIRKLDPEIYEVLGIAHDRDPADDIWEDAKLKTHYHIIIRIKDAKKKKAREKVKKLLELLGVHYDKERDKDLYEHHGVENIGDWNVYALYLTHDTPKAIADGKVHYSPRKIVSNISQASIQKMSDKADQLKKQSATEPLELMETVKNLVAERKDFELWLSDQPYNVKRNKNLVQILRDTYGTETEKKYGKGVGKNMIAIFIGGEGNTAKTTSTLKGCEALKMKVYDAPQGTGKWDDLTLEHDAILLDDSTPKSELLGLIQDRVVKFHRRNSNDRYFAGDLIVVTSNLDFAAFAYKCGYPREIPKLDGRGNIVTEENEEGKSEQVYVPNPEYLAFASRFFICHVEPLDQGRYYLVRDDNNQGRGNESRWAKKKKMFSTFLKAFNDNMIQYTRADYRIDTQLENEKERKRLLKALHQAS